MKAIDVFIILIILIVLGSIFIPKADGTEYRGQYQPWVL